MGSNKVKKTELVPPDGGWGWVICIAYALNNIVVLPLISNIGLIFKETFQILEIDVALGFLIISFNYASGMLLSFFGGPILKRFGYRKVAITGSLFVAFGIIMTSFAKSFWTIFIWYSVMSSVGIALVMASFTLAINTFFREKRSKAIGLGMSMTGLGQILMPLLIKLLLREYTPSMATFILGGLCLHSFVASLLLRPVEWYMKKPEATAEEVEPLNNPAPDVVLIENEVVESNEKSKIPNGTHIEEHSRNKVAPAEAAKSNKAHRWFEPDEINLGSSVNIFDEIQTKPGTEVAQNKDEKRTVWSKIVEFFHLELMKDPIFVNILVGLSLVNCADINFTSLLPFIFKDLSFTTDETANLVAIIASCDVLFRFLSPFIGDWCNKGPRVMFLLSLIIVIFARITLLFAGTYTAMIVVALAIGIAKGIRTVYMNIVIPNYIAIEMLPFASGIQMLINGFILLIFGPILGKIRDASGSYSTPIIVINIVTTVTIITWSIEFIFCRNKKNEDSAIEDG